MMQTKHRPLTFEASQVKIDRIEAFDDKTFNRYIRWCNYHDKKCHEIKAKELLRQNQ